MFEVIVVDMICEINPSFNDMIIWIKDGKNKFLYSQLIKAVYEMLLSTIVFCNKLSKHLTNHGLTQNEYNMCTFNKMVNGEQITIQFHVDDLNVSYKDQVVLDNFLDKRRSEFGQEDELAENRGLVHEYLDITISSSILGKVVLTMLDYHYLEDVVVQCAEDLKTVVFTIQEFFKVVEDSPRLPSKNA